MDIDSERPDEQSRLLPGRRPSTQSIISSHMSKEEQFLGETSVGERLPYSHYTTIDWLHDLVSAAFIIRSSRYANVTQVKSSFRYREIRNKPGLRNRLYALFDSSQGWIIAAISGICTAVVAAFVDLAVSTVSDWKTGYCTTNMLSSKEFCCTDKEPMGEFGHASPVCEDWKPWADAFWPRYAIYVAAALLFGAISGLVTLTTKADLPMASPGQGDRGPMRKSSLAKQSTKEPPVAAKSMYLAAGSGIPELKTVASGFVIPHLFDFKVLVVKAVGSIFAVSTGMCLGKEGPFVHISVCVAHQVARFVNPKFEDNGKEMRETYIVGCAAGLAVAFGAPIGLVLSSLPSFR